MMEQLQQQQHRSKSSTEATLVAAALGSNITEGPTSAPMCIVCCCALTSKTQFLSGRVPCPIYGTCSNGCNTSCSSRSRSISCSSTSAEVAAAAVVGTEVSAAAASESLMLWVFGSGGCEAHL